MTGVIVAVIAVMASLLLALRGMRAHQMAPRTLVMMAGTWIVIIAVITFLFWRFG
jgi:hypothetical protein